MWGLLRMGRFPSILKRTPGMIRRFHILSLSAVALLAIAWLAAVDQWKTDRQFENSPSALFSKSSRHVSSSSVTSRASGAAELSPVENESVSFSNSSRGPVMGATSEVQPQFVWQETKSIPVDSVLPGNTLSVREQQVSVTAYQNTSQGNALAVVVTQKKQPDLTEYPVGETPEAEVPQGSSPNTVASPQTSHTPLGFTYEEELFRTKWGWNAFAQVQREAVLHPETSP